jgi:hypothetical protein
MAITLKTAVTTPALAEKTFESMWILDLAIRAHSLESASIYINTSPFNSETGEILKSDQTPTRCDLFDAVANVPEVAQAYGAIMLAVPALAEYVEAKEAAAKLETEQL